MSRSTRAKAVTAVLAGVSLLFMSSCSRKETPEQDATAATQAPQATAAQPVTLPPAVPGTAPENPYSPEQIERGEYLVVSSGCNDCHTPWVFSEELGMAVPDMSRTMSGHPEGGPDPRGTLGPGDIVLVGPTFTSFALPFGIVYSQNLTPDIDTGIGTWTEEMFVDIFRKGRHLGGGGRPPLPPMPWLWYRAMPDEDLVAIYAYLRSLPPIRSLTPSPKVPEEVMWKLRDGFDKMMAEQDSH
jgi:hypothetical protein